MTLSVTVINTQDNTIVNTEQPTILIDEMLSNVKEKLFAMNTGIDTYPNLLKVHIKQDGKIIPIIINNSLLVSFVDGLPNEPVIYITNLLNELETRFNNTQLFNALERDSVFNVLFETLKEEYIELLEEDFEFALKITIYNQNPVVYANYEQFIREYIERVTQQQSSLYNKYKIIEDNLEKFNKLVYEMTDYDDYYKTTSTNQPIFIYNDISIILRGENYESGIKGRFVKLEKIFNVLELSETIPFIAYNESTSQDPKIRIYDRLADIISERELKNWILNEKKKLNILSYKKVKGIIIKYKIPNTMDFVSINIQNNGVIEGNYTNNNNNTVIELEDIIKVITSAADKVIDNINKLQGVFFQSKRLEYNSIRIDSISGYLETLTRLKIEQLASTLNNQVINSNIFELKDTLSQDVLSLYYKKFGKREGDGLDTERRGITVNIRDNPYKMDSSIVNIYGAYHNNQIETIIKQLIILSRLSQKIIRDLDDDTEQKVKERSHIKDLRKQGVKILSTKCQKPRQPIVVTGKQTGVTYTLDFEGRKYICPKKDYPYPGFTNENIVCCFKKDQRRRDAYIRNVKSENFDIMVQPSNKKIKVIDPQTKVVFETFPIKVVSDYVDGFDEFNSMSRYYYLSETNMLIPITNNQLVEDLDQDENLHWLDIVPLVKIISEPPKNKCNFTPDLNNKSIKNINTPCLNYSKNNSFGYNLNSFPCCFDKPRDEYITRRKKSSDITKQHILISDKILDYQRIGILPAPIDKLLNTIIKHDTGKYYRMGVVQNSAALLNVILLGINNTINGKYINNSSEFRKFISNYITENPDEFPRLNEGNIALKYKTLDEYKRVLLDTIETSKPILPNDIIDIVQQITSTNIFIIDIPYKFSESTKIPDYHNIKLLCNPNIKINLNNPYIILLKRINTYELIIYMNQNVKSPIQTVFKYKKNSPVTSNIVNFFVDYYSSSCVRENVFPESFPYTEMLSLEEIIKYLSNTEHSIIAQFQNDFNKVDYVLTKRGVILSIKESGTIANLRILKLENFVISGKLLDVSKYSIGILQINKIFKELNISEIQLLGVSLNNQFVNAVLTSYGQFVPVKPIEYSVNLGLKPLLFKYYPDVNRLLRTNDLIPNEQMEYTKYISDIKEQLFKIKTELASKISENETFKSQILTIVNKTQVSRFEKINSIVNIFKNINLASLQIETSLLNFLLPIIANEMLNDNVENLLLNNLVVSDTFNPNEIVKRDSESILLNIADIRKWLKERMPIEQNF